jgi:hypothetical protein
VDSTEDSEASIRKNVPLGKECSICGRVHVVRALGDVPVGDVTKIKNLDHHIFAKGYIGSLIKEKEVWEFYEHIRAPKNPRRNTEHSL